MSYTINDINTIIGTTAGFPVNNAVRQLVIDSRKIYFPETSLFFALESAQKDGHIYIPELYKKGVKSFVVKTGFDESRFPQAGFIKVENTLQALQNLAAYHRQKFTYPVIGITGSNGKTIVKEWLFHLLHNDYNIVRSPKSYNSQVGVPLSVWQMDATNNLAIFEAGISLPGEMEKLQQIIDPGIGIFTFLGNAHDEGFNNHQQKIKEKLQLFSNSKVIIYCEDETELNNAVTEFAGDKTVQLFSWGKTITATVQILSVDILQEKAAVKVQHQNQCISIDIPFTDEASVHNVLTCVATLFYLDFSAEQVKERLQQLRPVEMRLELKQGNNNCSIINDSYSADINSLTIALDFLEQQQQHAKKTLILSDLLETGQNEQTLYQNIASIVQQKNISRFIGIGPQLQQHHQLFSATGFTAFFNSTEEFLQQLPQLHFKDETILLKGARIFRFEKISRQLEQKQHQTFLEIDLNAIRHNLRAYKNHLHKNVKMMAMVKAFSYGSGSFEIASLLQHTGIDYLGVAYADEGVELKKAGIQTPIMVMNTEEAGFDAIIQYNLEPELYSFHILNAFKNYLELNNISHYPVHIKYDTGMHRLGFEQAELDDLCEVLVHAKAFKVVSVFSHLAGSADAAHDAFTNEQGNIFKSGAKKIEAALVYPVIKHIANTSAIHRHPQLQMDMVRLGIGMYGVDENETMQAQLKNVTTLKTTISQIKHIKKGESVGYSRSAIAAKNMTIATVRIGYADGYPRLLSNGVGYMLVNGQLAAVSGRVCMDMTMLDITHITAAEEDEVIVFGEDLPVTKLAQWAQTIPYEILTNISQRVRRLYFEE
ncbi:MAG: bifunctional UDP-N-acetylmuramoyl-tripeptide:D-alanyl-D-alanine ligase/alanine racemase [Sphingobacteriaceae bacterium]|nr:MAG: bifunctional UDP-N-acetylmuramoyl-tripeptide:D-alanyl-D-alanine ligase/alanine racemase [Sphingobacteriaceae bacterium]